MFVLIGLFINQTKGQNNLSETDKVYQLNSKSEIPITVGLLGLSFYGFYKLDQKPVLDTATVLSLDQEDVWAFDRVVFNQWYRAIIFYVF